MPGGGDREDRGPLSGHVHGRGREGPRTPWRGGERPEDGERRREERRRRLRARAGPGGCQTMKSGRDCAGHRPARRGVPRRRPATGLLPRPQSPEPPAGLPGRRTCTDAGQRARPGRRAKDRGRPRLTSDSAACAPGTGARIIHDAGARPPTPTPPLTPAGSAPGVPRQQDVWKRATSSPVGRRQWASSRRSTPRCVVRKRAARSSAASASSSRP